MAKTLSFISTALISASTAFSAAAAASASYSQEPAILHHIHKDMVHRLHRTLGINAATPSNVQPQPQRQQLERFTETDDNCPGTPMLWKITEDSTGKHVGFGVGTMHMPADVVVTEGAYNSLLSAIADSCDVYAELNMLNTNVTTELIECTTTYIVNAPYLKHIPDATLVDEIRTKLLDITTTYIEPNNYEVAQVIASRMEDFPLAEIQRMILYANTPEYMANHSQTLYTGVGVPTLDANMLSLGRPANDLEDPADQCDLLDLLYPSASSFEEAYAQLPDEMSQSIRDSLTLDLSTEIALYQCGNIDAFIEGFEDDTITMDEMTGNNVLTKRNMNMAKKMDEELQMNSARDERVLFAVGVAHWVIGGENSLESLLKGYGYNMEHIPKWDKGDMEDHSMEHCDAIFNPETGLFDQDPDDDVVPSPAGVTKEPTHSVIDEDDSVTWEGLEGTDNATYGNVEGGGDNVPTTTPPGGGDDATKASSSVMIGISNMILGGLGVVMSCLM